MKRLLPMVLAIAVVACVNPSVPASPTPTASFEANQPSVPVGRPNNWDAKWDSAFKMNGFGTRYDAYQHAHSWYDTPRTWVYASADECRKNPGWKCYHRDMGGWTSLVRPWKNTLKNMYAALGPRLRKYFAAPRWHTIPTQKLLIISTHTGKSVEVWIADSCTCHGADRKEGTWDDSLIDLSPEVWAALGAFKDEKIPPWPYANTTPGFKNTIEIRFLP